jgi:hypothetical protein
VGDKAASSPRGNSTAYRVSRVSSDVNERHLGFGSKSFNLSREIFAGAKGAIVEESPDRPGRIGREEFAQESGSGSRGARDRHTTLCRFHDQLLQRPLAS